VRTLSSRPFCSCESRPGEPVVFSRRAQVHDQINEDWNKVAGGTNGDLLRAVVAAYLSTSHRDDPGTGCVVAALGSDVARKSPAVRHAVTEGLRPFIELLTRAAPGRTKVARRKRALAIYASLVGAMVLARAVDDDALSKGILEAVKASV
jgi:TetR/AcrR family transcriptional regulator, transcriptional repressor for nem operon